MRTLQILSSASMALVLSLAACGQPDASQTDSEVAAAESPQQLFLSAFTKHCGKAFDGKLASNDAADADFAKEKLVMHITKCSDDEVRIPFHVGDDRSRTWVLTRTDNGLRLKHDHRHEDGSEDAVTQYGGDTASSGTAARQEFPVDAQSIATFKKEGLDQSVTNIWAMEVSDAMFAYELRREGRFFRVEFDLTKPVEAPPPAWGS